MNLFKKQQTISLFSGLILLLFTAGSCVGGKYIYSFDTGKKVDFNKGLWLVNDVQSNSRKFEPRLDNVVKVAFEGILEDSLFTLNELRVTKLLPLKIPFELESEEQLKLYEASGCDFLITTRGTVISNGAGSISFDMDNGYYSASNESLVEIMIYDLANQVVVSSGTVRVKATNENSHFPESSSDWPRIHSSAQALMLKGAKNLIKRYNKNQLGK